MISLSLIIYYAYLWTILGISWAYLVYILGICWAYLRHIFRISGLYFAHCKMAKEEEVKEDRMVVLTISWPFPLKGSITSWLRSQCIFQNLIPFLNHQATWYDKLSGFTNIKSHFVTKIWRDGLKSTGLPCPVSLYLVFSLSKF